MTKEIKEAPFLICSLGEDSERFNFAMKEVTLSEDRVIQIAYNYDSMLKEILKK